MTKQEIIDYIMTTPSNPNKAVLEGMLDSLSDEEGGSGSSRILLYENGALDISRQTGNWLFANVPNPVLSAWFEKNAIGNWILEVDNEELSSEMQANNYIGVESPGDTTHVGVNKIGCSFALFDNTTKVASLSFIMLDKNYFTAGTHSVKIYKEV